MNNWQEHFKDDDIFFVTPDVKRGVGFAGILSKYHIICADSDPIIPVLRNQGAKIFCLEEEGVDTTLIRNSGKLLALPCVIDYIRSNSKDIPKIMYFKPSLKLDSLIKQNKFMPIGNNAYSNELFEDKISFYDLVVNNGFRDYVIPAVVGILGKLNYLDLQQKLNLPLVIQFGHGWAGKTTFLIPGKKEFISLSKKFPYTKVKVSKYVDGFTVLNNCCLYNGKVFISSPAIQIDGISSLGGKFGVTCGRQWPVRFISGKQIDKINKISQKMAKLMTLKGFRGFFGIDFLIDRSGKIYLSEVNARMTASSAFCTLLEIGQKHIPLLAYHLAEFLGKAVSTTIGRNEELIASQLIIRRPVRQAAFKDKLFGVFKFENAKAVFIRDDYHPDELGKNEFIFIRRNKIDEKADNEFARIESKREVVENPKKLKNWVRGLITEV